MLQVRGLDYVKCTTGLEVRLLAALIREKKLRQYQEAQLHKMTQVAESLARDLAEKSKPTAPSKPALPPSVLNAPADRICAGNATMKQIQLAVCDRFNISMTELRSQRRQAYVMTARQTACMLIKALTTMSYPQIGRALGNRDHATILHAAKKLAPVHERLVAELTPADTLATWVKRTYAMVMHENVPLARPKARQTSKETIDEHPSDRVGVECAGGAPAGEGCTDLPCEQR